MELSWGVEGLIPKFHMPLHRIVVILHTDNPLNNPPGFNRFLCHIKQPHGKLWACFVPNKLVSTSNTQHYSWKVGKLCTVIYKCTIVKTLQLWVEWQIYQEIWFLGWYSWYTSWLSHSNLIINKLITAQAKPDLVFMYSNSPL